MSDNKEEKKKEKLINNTEIKGIIFIAIGFLSFVAIYTNLAGLLSVFAQRIFFFVLGVGAYAIPIYLLYLGFSYLKNNGTVDIDKRLGGVTLLVLTFILLVGTIYIQTSENPDSFGKNLKTIVSLIGDGKGGFNGGVVVYLVTFTLYKLIGAIGSYIVYIALAIISFMIIFKLSVLDVGNKAKDMKKNIKSKNNSEKQGKAKKEKIKKETSNEELLEDVNKKIKVLDSMKEQVTPEEDKKTEEIKIMEPLQVESEKEVENGKEVENEKTLEEKLEKDTDTQQTSSEKKEKLDNDLKEDVNKEIDTKLNEEETEPKKYIFPKTELLKVNSATKLNDSDKQELIDHAKKLEETLESFNVEAKVVQVSKGPSVTRFELQPSPGVKVSKIVNLSDDIALGLAASGVRIEAPIPGKSAVGIEVPNKKQTPVFLREVLESDEFKKSNKKLAFALGKDIAGSCVVGDLSKMPHTLIAGATGSGKSVCINSLIISLLYKYSPEEVKLLLVDPKVVELNVYNGIPHLLIPVVIEPKKAAAALNWAVNEMTKRYSLFAEKGVRNIDSYNALLEKGEIEEKLPFIVIIVDELADLMMVCPNDVEDYIGRLAQMARAAGMHLVIATQRPSVDVITGVIKANIPSRISFAVSSQVDSRTILDSSGAEKLLGKGDMLYYPVGAAKPLRIQGCFISEEEVEKVVEFIKNDENGILYKEEILDHINKEAEGKNSEEGEEADELLPEAIKLVVEYDQASTSFLQRRLRIGFNRAARIMEQLEEREVISPRDGTKPRQVLMKKEELAVDEET
ncbi:MAG: DNA translocase FtsK [Clostridium sp.]|nr:DNA translocase FtsK [Clostridium sp.]